MTIVVPDGVSAAGMEQVWYVPTIAAATGIPTVAEVTAGFPIGCAMTASFNPTGEQEKTEDLRLCLAEALEAFGRNKFTIDPLEYVYDPQDPTDTTMYEAYATLKQGVTGFLVDRRGVAGRDDIAAGEFVDVYPVTFGFQNRVPVDMGAGGQKFRVTQSVALSGAVLQDVAVAT